MFVDLVDIILLDRILLDLGKNATRPIYGALLQHYPDEAERHTMKPVCKGLPQDVQEVGLELP